MCVSSSLLAIKTKAAFKCPPLVPPEMGCQLLSGASRRSSRRGSQQPPRQYCQPPPHHGSISSSSHGETAYACVLSTLNRGTGFQVTPWTVVAFVPETDCLIADLLELENRTFEMILYGSLDNSLIYLPRGHILKWQVPYRL